MNPRTPEWITRRERGSLWLLRVMCVLSLRLGRRATRPILHGIALYFLITSVQAGHASRAYLSRVLGREPTLGDRYRHVLAFATTIHDRVFLLNDRYSQFDIRMHGHACFDRIDERQRGGLLFGAHVGSFEVLRALARVRPDLAVSLAMYPENAKQINRTLAAINPAAVHDIIALGTIDAMLAVRDRVDLGGLVGILADRALDAEHALSMEFLGAPASFPVGPFRMAALLRCPVYFMVALYRGGNRYDVFFERLADFSALDRPRTEAMKAGIASYADALARYCQLAPYNWFNFFDFWASPP